MNSLQLIDRIKKNRAARILGIDINIVHECIDEWSRPHRYYHSLENHLFPLFEEIATYSGFPNDVTDIMELIALFHDVVYDSKSTKCNEEQSAEFFMGCIAENEKDCKEATKIANSILDTQYMIKRDPYCEESELFQRIDLGSLLDGNWPNLMQAERLLRKENQFISYPTYKSMRITFLKKFADLYSKECDTATINQLIDYVTRYKPKIGVYAGSFKPFHIGHLNILEQAERLFDKVIILCASNPDKVYGIAQDKDWYSDVKDSLPYHEVVRYPGLTTNVLAEIREYADVTLIRGLRNGYDLQYEMNQLRFMEELDVDTNVVFFTCGAAYQHISSSQVRQLLLMSRPDGVKYLPTKYDYYRNNKE